MELSTPAIIGIAATLAVVLLIAIARFSANYIKVPPNVVAIFSGRKQVL